MAVYHMVYDKVICRLTPWRLVWALIMLNKQQSRFPLSVSSNNAVAISGTGCTDPLRDGLADMASMEMCVTSTMRFFCRKLTYSIAKIHMPGLSL